MSGARLYGCVAAVGLSAAVLALPIASTSGRQGSPATPTSPVAVLYTSQAYGQIRSCNCTKFRYGGYGREATLLGGLAKNPAGTVLIECGDALAGGASDQGKLKTELAVKTMPMIGYAAYVPGDSEVAADLRVVKAACQAQRVPLVCANVFELESGKRICSAYSIRKTAGGVRVAIVGLLGEELLPDDVLRTSRVKIGDGAALLRKLAPTLRKQADLLVVVAHMPIDKARLIADLGIGDVVICSHIDKKLIMPAEGQNTVEVPFQSAGKGVFLESLTRSNWSVGRLDLKPAGAGKWKAASNTLYYLDRAYPEDARIVKLYDDYSMKVRDLMLQQRAKLRADVEKKLRARGFDPDKIRERNKTFVGSAVCATCHQKENEVWASTLHSRAMASLKKTNQEFDPECIGCHSTGYNQRGGFVNAQETPTLANVQCESCHGPGKAHATKPTTKLQGAGEDTCRGCHTDELSPDFDYDVSWKKVAH